MMNANPDSLLLKACRICNGQLTEFFHYEAVPIAGTYLTEPDLGKEPLLPLTATLCQNCGLIQLREVVPSSIYTSYRFMGTSSVGYRAYLEQMAESLITGRDVRNKKVLEIGCSDGYLLKQLREKGSNQVFGYEPASQLQQACLENDIPVSGAFFSCDSLSECPILPADVIIMRHVLEHIDDLHGFLNAVLAALDESGFLIIEVPDVEVILTNHLYFHFYHEHLSYFSLISLQKLLSQYGFNIIWHRMVKIHSGSLYIICEHRHGIYPTDLISSQGANYLEKTCRAFATGMQTYLDKLHRFIAQECTDAVRFAGYGAAHRTVVACSLAKMTHDHIKYLVDKNPYLHGFYTPGAHLPIYSPNRLYQEPTDAIIIFATSFEEEIIKEQQTFREAGGRFVSLLPEPRYLP
jgi:novobiocin biosynthesis protein NovU